MKQLPPPSPYVRYTQLIIALTLRVRTGTQRRPLDDFSPPQGSSVLVSRELFLNRFQRYSHWVYHSAEDVFVEAAAYAPVLNDALTASGSNVPRNGLNTSAYWTWMG